MTDVLHDPDAMHVDRAPSPLPAEPGAALPDAPDIDLVADFLARLRANQCRYIGIYSPGDYGQWTYRVVVPAPGNGRGRGFRSVREEVVLETDERGDIDKLVAAVVGLADGADGPVAVRHIVNPSPCADEGLRLIWARDGPAARAEMADWARRDGMRRAGRTVRAASDGDGGAGGSAGAGEAALCAHMYAPRLAVAINPAIFNPAAFGWPGSAGWYADAMAAGVGGGVMKLESARPHMWTAERGRVLDGADNAISVD